MKQLGKLNTEPEGYKVVFERLLPYNVMTVWESLTNPAKLAIWFMEVEMDLVEGGKMIIRFPDEAKTETFGKITRLEPGRVFEFVWEEELVKWELEPMGDAQCLLTLTHSRIPEEFVKSAPAGWHIMLQHLEEALNGRTEPYPFSEEETDEQKRLKKEYNKQLSTLKPLQTINKQS